jgi:putative DNA primase/helicase
MRDGAKIAARLGGYHHKKGWQFRCPCHDDRDASACIRNDGLVTCFAKCKRDKVEAALDALGFTDDGKSPRRLKEAYADPPPDPAVITPWMNSECVEGTLAETYLRRRGITLPISPNNLRFLPHAGVHGQPAMLAAVWGDKHLIGIQYTYLRSDAIRGSRINAGTLGHSAVRPTMPIGDELGLAEGVETAMSASQIVNVAVWATLGAMRLGTVRIPHGIKLVHLFGDNDATGREHIKHAVERYTGAGLRVRVWWPPDGCKDFNDILKPKEVAA